MPEFLIDSDIFIQAYRERLPLDVATSFWNKIAELANEGKIRSIDKVKGELYTNPDDLTGWCDDNLPGEFFLPTVDLVATAYRETMTWASAHPRFMQNAKDEFARYDAADAWLISMAKDQDFKIVTGERSHPERTNRIMIPDACRELGLASMNVMEMFRELGETF